MAKKELLLSPMSNGIYLQALEEEFAGDYFQLIDKLGKIYVHLIQQDPGGMFVIQIADLNSDFVIYYSHGQLYDQRYRPLKPKFQYEPSLN